jgi:hypothetical protein
VDDFLEVVVAGFRARLAGLAALTDEALGGMLDVVGLLKVGTLMSEGAE